ncbi:hypothetical protein BGW38_002917 [Lunasporangiospora selenospora]|uniref:Uncharacterized protein n=1 Tax=Lunasporangiospora selenospora TaxID=979761 RepID=A0A9P6FS46_9FUNG|nr:hypothetical protein BGW38_002917 [Lunasporangiospora selenospora]
MKINRRHFVGILYDCVLFEYASQLQHQHQHHGDPRLQQSPGQQQVYVLALEDLADTFAFIADFYKHHRAFMDIPCDQFITRNQLHTVAGLLDYIEAMDRGTFEIFPLPVQLREEAPSISSTSSASSRRERRRRESQAALDDGGAEGGRGRILSSDRSLHSFDYLTGLDPLRRNSRTWATDIYNQHRILGHEFGAGTYNSNTSGSSSTVGIGGHRNTDSPYCSYNDVDTDLDDEYSLAIPALGKTDIQTFLWEYAYMPEDYHDDIATLIRYLRKDEWFMNGSKGPIVSFEWGLEGVQKYTKEYNRKKIHRVEEREQEEVKKQAEELQRQQEEWQRHQELAREQETAKRIRTIDEFVWKMYEPTKCSFVDLENLIKTLETEIGEYFGYCFVAITAIGSFGAGLHTHQNDLDMTLTGSIKHVTVSALAEALRHFGYKNVVVGSEGIPLSPPVVSSPSFYTHPSTPTAKSLASFRTLPARVDFVDPKTRTTCHLLLNSPIDIYRAKLVQTYAKIDSRFGPVLMALVRHRP